MRRRDGRRKVIADVEDTGLITAMFPDGEVKHFPTPGRLLAYVQRQDREAGGTRITVLEWRGATDLVGVAVW